MDHTARNSKGLADMGYHNLTGADITDMGNDCLSTPSQRGHKDS